MLVALTLAPCIFAVTIAILVFDERARAAFDRGFDDRCAGRPIERYPTPAYRAGRAAADADRAREPAGGWVTFP